MEKKKIKKSKMTLDKLASMSHNEFGAVREEIQVFREEMQESFHAFKEGVVKEVSQTVMESNDKLATKIDSFLKDSAAHDSLHYGITDQLLDHETRLKKVETKTAK